VYTAAGGEQRLIKVIHRLKPCVQALESGVAVKRTVRMATRKWSMAPQQLYAAGNIRQTVVPGMQSWAYTTHKCIRSTSVFKGGQKASRGHMTEVCTYAPFGDMPERQHWKKYGQQGIVRRDTGCTGRRIIHVPPAAGGWVSDQAGVMPCKIVYKCCSVLAVTIPCAFLKTCKNIMQSMRTPHEKIYKQEPIF
jgi:hypothetical protein